MRRRSVLEYDDYIIVFSEFCLWLVTAKVFVFSLVEHFFLQSGETERLQGAEVRAVPSLAGTRLC